MTQKLLPDHRQNRGISPKDARKQPAMTASSTPSCCSRYVQQDSCITCWCSLPNSRDITRGLGHFIQHAGEKSCMCAVHGGADRSSWRDLPRKCSDIHAWSCSRTARARADAPASMCRPCTLRTRTPQAQDGRQVHICRAESALDGHSGFAHAVIMSVQTQFCGQCGMRAPLHRCTALPPGSAHACSQPKFAWTQEFF